MALQRDTKYPGRFTTATSEHPQGPFKNRTSSTSQDGSYLEKDWLNDWDGFFGSLLNSAGLTPDGNVDAVGASQYFNALVTVASVAPVGTSRNLKCSIAAASATATFTADEVVVASVLGGKKYLIANLNASINLATTGAGGMDTGSAPASGYVAIYAILNPTTGAKALMGVNATSAIVPEVYSGSYMPSGYTASALISILPINASGIFPIVYQKDRTVIRDLVIAVTRSSVVSSYTALLLSTSVPKNAKSCKGNLWCDSNGTSGITILGVAVDANGIGYHQAYYANASGGGDTTFEIALVTSQTIYYKFTNSNTLPPVGTITICGYTF